MSLQGRSVLITGGGGGLGCEVTARFVRAGAEVTVPTQAGDHDRLCAHVDDLANRVTCVPADLTDETAVAQLICGLPRLDVLVHLVGGFSMAPIEAIEMSEVRRLVDLNVVTTLLMLKHAVPRMRETGFGRIVTVASKSAEVPVGHMGLYAATKAAVLALTRSVADECKDEDITANCVLPTVIDTPANRAAMGDGEAGKWVTPASLAETIANLASEAAGDLRGTAVRVFGGL